MQNKNIQLGEGNIWKLIVKLSIPIIIGMIVSGLYGVVDAFFVARGIGTLAIGAVSIVFPIQAAVLAVAVMIGNGMAAIISRKLGAKDYAYANRVAGNALFLSLLISIGIGGLGFFFLHSILRLVGATEAMMPYASGYLGIFFLGTPVVMIMTVFNDMFRSEGKAKLMMFSVILSSVLNIILDPVFIFVFDMGVSGAAIATVISEAVSVLFGLYFYSFNKTVLKIRLKDFKLIFSNISDIISLGIPLFLGYAGASISVVVTNLSLSHYTPTNADLFISASGLMCRVAIFTALPLLGLLLGFQTIAGFNFGAGKLIRVWECTKVTIIIIFAYCFMITIIMELIPGSIFGLFSKDAELINIGAHITRVVFLLFVLYGLATLGPYIFQIQGKAKYTLFLSLARNFYFLIPALLILPGFVGVNGVWYASPVAYLLAFTLNAVFVIREIKSLLKRARV